MKTLNLLFVVAAILATGFGPVDAGTAAAMGGEDPAATVDRFFRSLVAGDTHGASALLDPRVLIFESGGVERSREEYAAHHLGSDAEFLKPAKYRLLSRAGDSVGDLAWVATEARLTTRVHDKPVEMVTDRNFKRPVAER